MFIKELKDTYPLVYRAALKNQELAGNSRNDGIALNLPTNVGNFNWSHSPQEEDFWRTINRKNFNEAFKLHPELSLTSKYKVGDMIQSNPGGWQYVETGLEKNGAIGSCKSDQNIKSGKCTKVAYSYKHKVFFYKIGDYGNMFTENCITLVKDEVKSKNLEDYVGRYLQALVDGPDGGFGVNKGDYGKIVSNDTADFPEFEGYSCEGALDYPSKYRLMPEGFVPGKVKEERKTRVVFHDSKSGKDFYCDDFIESYKGLKTRDKVTLNSTGGIFSAFQPKKGVKYTVLGFAERVSSTSFEPNSVYSPFLILEDAHGKYMVSYSNSYYRKYIDKVEEPTESKPFDLTNTKIKVNSKEESRLVQEYAFKAGWGWTIKKTKEVMPSKKPYLYFDNNHFIFYGTDYSSFKESSYKELTLSDLGLSSGHVRDNGKSPYNFGAPIEEHGKEAKAMFKPFTKEEAVVAAKSLFNGTPKDEYWYPKPHLGTGFIMGIDSYKVSEAGSSGPSTKIVEEEVVIKSSRKTKKPNKVILTV